MVCAGRLPEGERCDWGGTGWGVRVGDSEGGWVEHPAMHAETPVGSCLKQVGYGAQAGHGAQHIRQHTVGQVGRNSWQNFYFHTKIG